jgi:hypothetical protein
VWLCRCEKKRNRYVRSKKKEKGGKGTKSAHQSERTIGDELIDPDGRPCVTVWALMLMSAARSLHKLALDK